MPTLFNIFSGGNASNGTHQIFPSANTDGNPPMGYADHQRSRSYTVTRVLDFRKKQNFGNNSRIDQATDFYLSSVTPPANGDSLVTHLIIPKTKIKAVFYEVVVPAAGFNFDIKSQIGGTVFFAGVSGAAAGYGLLDTEAGMPALFTVQDYLDVLVNAIPTGGFHNSGLLMYVSMKVEDYDNGNFL